MVVHPYESVDIVERLRNKDWLWTVPGAMRENAAAEIERLRTENNRLVIAALLAEQEVCRDCADIIVKCFKQAEGGE